MARLIARIFMPTRPTMARPTASSRIDPGALWISLCESKRLRVFDRARIQMPRSRCRAAHSPSLSRANQSRSLAGKVVHPKAGRNSLHRAVRFTPHQLPHLANSLRLPVRVLANAMTTRAFFTRIIRWTRHRRLRLPRLGGFPAALGSSIDVHGTSTVLIKGGQLSALRERCDAQHL